METRVARERKYGLLGGVLGWQQSVLCRSAERGQRGKCFPFFYTKEVSKSLPYVIENSSFGGTCLVVKMNIL
jgi:hypothetical protein